MSRLADRILTKCRTVKLDDIIVDSTDDDILLSELKKVNPSFSANDLPKVKSKYSSQQPKATQEWSYGELFNDAPIIAADDVGLYFSTLPEGTEVQDIVASMAPPFEKFFIEFQNVPNIENLYSWGVLFEAYPIEKFWSSKKIRQSFEEDGSVPRWILHLATFIERRKGEPVGPIAFHYAGLADDGTWFRHNDGKVFWEGSVPELTAVPPEAASLEWVRVAGSLNLPALLAVSFMHCKNVKTPEVLPPEKLSKKFRKKHGNELVRFHTLEIDPIKKVIERERSKVGGDFRALRCFKWVEGI